MTIDLNNQVQKAFSRLENLSKSNLPSRELTSKLVSELNIALLELQTTAVELLEQNEEMVASRLTLVEERRHYQELFDFAPEGYLVTDTEGIILDANTAATNLFNESRSLLIGKPLAIYVHSAEQLTFRNLLVEMKNGTIAQIEDLEFIMLSAKRASFPVSITVGKIIAFSERTTEFRWLLRDITRSKRIEMELIETKEEALKLKMGHEMARLDGLSLVGQVAAGIGHEIRNPMTTVRGFLQLISSKEECSKFNDYFALMIEELDRANLIITEFLSLASDKAVELKDQSLKEIVQNIFPLIQADGLITDKHIQLKLHEVAEIPIDRNEIHQLILNLVLNGSQAMSTGGTMIIKTFMDQEDIVLAVQDDGKGIPPEVLEKMGTPFFTTKENGTGLGLAVCYSIAARHNAKIDVETGLTGTTFFVRFKKKSYNIFELC